MPLCRKMYNVRRGLTPVNQVMMCIGTLYVVPD
jgi:hypothetical protein